MKQIYLFAMVMAVFSSCSPETETRTHMDTLGNRMSDSLQWYIDSSLSQPSHELEGTGSPIASTTSTFAPLESSK